MGISTKTMCDADVNEATNIAWATQLAILSEHECVCVSLTYTE